MPPPQKKFEFLPENGGFWCILGLLFKIGQANGGGRPPPWIRHWVYLQPFLRDSKLLVENCDIYIPHLCLAPPQGVTPSEFFKH